MKMRREEAVRNNSHLEFGSRVLHEPDEGFIILATIEEHALSRTTIAYVIHVSARCHSSAPCHGANRDRNQIARSRPHAKRAARGQAPRRGEWRRNGV